MVTTENETLSCGKTKQDRLKKAENFLENNWIERLIHRTDLKRRGRQIDFCGASCLGLQKGSLLHASAATRI